MNKVAGFRPTAGLDWKIEEEDGVVFAGFGVVVVERGDAALLVFLLHISTYTLRAARFISRSPQVNGHPSCQGRMCNQAVPLAMAPWRDKQNNQKGPNVC